MDLILTARKAAPIHPLKMVDGAHSSIMTIAANGYESFLSTAPATHCGLL